jgi:hypothetical protein
MIDMDVRGFRWEDESSSSFFDPFLHAEVIVEDAFHYGYINWYGFQKALSLIAANRNGNWMFEKIKPDNTEDKNGQK